MKSMVSKTYIRPLKLKRKPSSSWYRGWESKIKVLSFTQRNTSSSEKSIKCALTPTKCSKFNTSNCRRNSTEVSKTFPIIYSLQIPHLVLYYPLLPVKNPIAPLEKKTKALQEWKRMICLLKVKLIQLP